MNTINKICDKIVIYDRFELCLFQQIISECIYLLSYINTVYIDDPPSKDIQALFS